jgi:hypothetical protein
MLLNNVLALTQVLFLSMVGKMSQYRTLFILPLFLMTCCLSNCSGAKESFLTVEMCVVNDAGINQLRKILEITARKEHLQFVDNTADAQHDMTVTSQTNRDLVEAHRLFHVAVQRSDGMGVTATNLGLPKYQVVLGFTDGADHGTAKAFADRMVMVLASQWKITTIPPRKGATPMRNCG